MVKYKWVFTIFWDWEVLLRDMNQIKCTKIKNFLYL